MMTSLNNIETSEVGENLSVNFDNYLVDESEAKEINSCLNFLSILDEETSNDSCDFTLFRKKEDTNPSNNPEKEESKDRETYDKDNIKEQDSVHGENIKNNGNEYIIETINDVSNPNTENENNDFSELKKDPLETNSNLDSNSQLKKSLDFKVTSRPFAEVLRVSTVSDKSMTLSKKETSSMLRSAKVIVLKVPQFSSVNPGLSINSENNSHSNKEKVDIKPHLKIFTKISKPNDTIKTTPLKIEKHTTSLHHPIITKPLSIKNIQHLKGLPKIILKEEENDKTLTDSLKENTQVKESKIPTIVGMSQTNILGPSKKEKITETIHVKKICNTGENDILDQHVTENITIKKVNDEITDNSDFSTKSDIMAEVDGEKISSDLSTNTESNHYPDVSFNELNSAFKIPQTANNNILPENLNNQLIIKKHPSLELNKQVLTQSNLCLNNLSSEAEIYDPNTSISGTQELFNSTVDQSDPEKLLHKDFKLHEKAVLETSIKKVRTRILDGKKRQKSKKFEKTVDLLKGTKSSRSSLQKKKNRTEKIKEDKYIPLIRTELPTFLNKLDLNESENTKQNNSITATSSTLNNEASSERNFNENDAQESDELSLQENVIGEEISELAIMKLCESFESVPFPPILPSQVKNLPWPSDEDIALLKNMVKSSSSENEMFEDSAFCDLSTFQDPLLKSGGNVTDSNSGEGSNIGENSLSSGEIIQGTDYNQSNNIDPLAILMEDNGISVGLHSSEEMISQPIIEDHNQKVEQSSVRKKDSASSGNTEPTVNLNLTGTLCMEEKQNPLELTKHCNEEVEKQLEDYASVTQKTHGIIYSFNKSSPLSFSAQNILENMFKHESYPSSSNMNTLAKLMEVQWKDVRDWFVARRNLNKKNGIYTRNQPLVLCPFCPDYHQESTNDAIVHLLQKDHIHNMLKSMEKDHLIFSKFQNSVESKSGETGCTQNSSLTTELRTHLYNSGPSPNDLSNKSGTKNERAPSDPQNFKIHSYCGERKKPTSSHHSGMNPTSNIRTISESCDEIAQNPSTNCVPLDSLHFNDESKRQRALESLKQMETNIYIGYRCPECSKIFHSEWLLIKHSISHKKLICCECNEVFVREDLLHHHLKEHLIESMDDEMYSMYICLKCYSLDCICLQETHCVPPTRDKYYIRPQMAKRSKPFRSAPHSGVNEHLKVTMKEFWHQFNASSKVTALGQEKHLNFSVNLPREGKSKTNLRFAPNVTPTYTNMTTFNCDMCESFFFTQDELREHITVHRIQARSKKKREGGEKKKENSESEFLKPTAPLNPLYFCAYCVKGFKRESTLCKHLKLECKELPQNISEQLINGVPFYLEKAGRSRHYKIKLPLSSQNKISGKPNKLKCHLCCLEFSKTEYIKHVCLETKIAADNISKEEINKCSSNNRIEQLESEENITKYYFLCSFCNIPMMSEEQLHSHIQNSCQKAPNEVKLELDSHTLSELVRLCKGIYFKKVRREALSEVLSPKKLRSILDISTFQESKFNYKRVKCKFCDKSPLKTFVKSHLLHQCKKVPEEFRTMLSTHKNRGLGKNQKHRIQKLKSIDNNADISANEKDIYTSSMSKDLYTKVEKGGTETSTNKSLLQPPIQTNLLYDCHLCEEKFKISKDFISHMSDFHCLKISEGACYKWLSVISTNKNSSTSQIEKDSPVKVLENDCHLEQDDHLENIAETLLVSDSTNLIEKAPQAVISGTSSEKRKEPSHQLMASPNKSQKMDDEELLDDLDNLDSFIETVQLEDSSFVSSATS